MDGRTNRNKAWEYFIATGAIPADQKNEYVLHHKDPTLKANNPDRYDEWRIEDLVPLTRAEHAAIHHTGKVTSEETKARQSESIGGYYATHEHPNQGKHLKEETRRKISEAHKGRKLTPEQRAKAIAALEEYRAEHPEGTNKGRIFPEEFGQKVSAALKEYYKTHDAVNKGVPCSERAKALISEKLTGRKLSAETRQRMSEAKKGIPSNFTGHHHTPEALKKISEAGKGRKVSEETRAKMAAAQGHPVQQFTLDGAFVAEYISMSDAQKKTGIRNIYRAITTAKTAGGFTWKWKVSRT